MIKFIEKHADDGIIQNKDGRSGVFKIEDSEVYIICNNEKTIYDLDDELSKILDDGWLVWDFNNSHQFIISLSIR
jgi:hypothetical protein